MTVSKAPRSVLFVPASRPERFAKAVASGADAVVIDLEDAVAPSAKSTAREALRDYLETTPDANIIVRVNSAGSQEFAADLALCQQQPGVTAIMVAKAQSTEALQQASATGKPVWPLVESALGVEELARIAKVKGVERVCFGALDMGLDLGITPETAGARLMLDRIRCDLVLHSKAAGLEAPIESVYPAIDDEQTLENMARQAREMGFAGMLCIHPRQLQPIHRGFRPDTTELEWARRVLAAVADGEGVFTVDGQMVDAPVIQRAQKIVDQAGDTAIG
ncbi:HpcH/HpaI aldolase/citrate lyase family protein [Marinobacterium arenosum]|uniref:HpcH/HpaI aldolase/citrate lyase family protein n=1 Tax=Marinobacterium arenosum TaxID=2862496 RepID=UPI001C982FFA|nr:CoA ester lyase [Marinobacterium arenosum]MBY4678791.1 CoA ester lyase [Marinobacterium arenosum]